MFHNKEEAQRTLDCTIKYNGLVKMVKTFPLIEVQELYDELESYKIHHSRYKMLKNIMAERLSQELPTIVVKKTRKKQSIEQEVPELTIEDLNDEFKE